MMVRSAGVALLALGFSACGSSSADALRGTWEARGGEMMLQFTEDGTFAASAPRGQTTGKYRYIEDGKLQMEFDGMSEVFGVSISEGVLTFCQANHGCERFREAE